MHLSPHANPIRAVVILFCLASSLACQSSSSDPGGPSGPSLSQSELIALGEEIFFTETFGGNGRTCGTCHPKENNFALDPAFIDTLPDNDPLFVAEFNTDLMENFENPELMRQFGLILENLDGFDDLPNKFVMRGVPHVLAQSRSINSPQGPHTGWSGDGAPEDRSLRSFAIGAVRQHFTLTLDREPGVDFRLPTELELDALEAFQMSLGRQEDLVLPLPLVGDEAQRGQAVFLDDENGKCNLCHSNAGAMIKPGGLGNLSGNGLFDTGIEDVPYPPGGETIPPDDGFGQDTGGTGVSEFNVPPLVEAADSGPFFHNNVVQTIEDAVAFYDSVEFDNSEAARLVRRFDPNDPQVGIDLEPDEILDIAAFLRVINALENIRSGLQFLEESLEVGLSEEEAGERLERAIHETEDSIQVLATAPTSLHPEAAVLLQSALDLIDLAIGDLLERATLTGEAIVELESARDLIVDPS